MSNYILGANTSVPKSKGARTGATASSYYLPRGLPVPAVDPGGLYGPYWEGARNERLMIQRNPATGAYQWPAQWIAHDTQSFELEWIEVLSKGLIYSWTRVWHSVHPALQNTGPYIVVIVELPHAGGVRMLGNLLGDPRQDVEIGAEVEAVFEHHNDASPPFTLIQWCSIGRG